MSMAMHSNESWEWSGASPRISFSHDLSQSDVVIAAAAVARVDASEPPGVTGTAVACDFDFPLSLPVDGDPSPADALFSDGKLLPLPPITPTTPHPRPSSLPFLPSPLTTILYSEKHQQPPVRPAAKKAAAAAVPFWGFGRSSSVSCCRARPPSSSSSSSGSFCPFPLIRSKSTGSALGPANSIAARRNRDLYSNYASGGGGGGGSPKLPLSSYNKSSNHANSSSSSNNNNGRIRISPILNEPAGSAAATTTTTTTTGVSIFNYLLCSCGNRSMRRELALQCTPQE